MMSYLRTNYSKKMIAFLLTMAVTALNKKLGLGLDPDTIAWIVSLAIIYIVGQSHVDGKKAANTTGGGGDVTAGPTTE